MADFVYNPALASNNKAANGNKPTVIKGHSVNKKHAYLAVVAASALVLGGCDKVESFFGNNDKSGELVQRIETKKNDGSVNMLLPDLPNCSNRKGRQWSISRRPKR